MSAELETPEQLPASPRARSALLLDFGAPLLEPLPATAPLSLWRDALTLVVTTWNALVVDEALGMTEHLAELRSAPPRAPGARRSVLHRRRRRPRRPEVGGLRGGALDRGALEVTRAGGELRLQIEVHAPPVPAR